MIIMEWNGMEWNCERQRSEWNRERQRSEWNYTVVGPILIIIAPNKSGSQIPFSG